MPFNLAQIKIFINKLYIFIQKAKTINAYSILISNKVAFKNVHSSDSIATF